jgi:N-methylhydantoinase B
MARDETEPSEFAMIPDARRFIGTSKRDDIAASLPSELELHTVSDSAQELDHATYEIVRHRMWSMADDMATVLKHMSGSPIVSEANDFNFVIGDEVGETVQIAQYNLELGAASDLAIGWTMRNRSRDPGIASGDMFFTNDPWVGGGLHQNDISLMQPLFWEGQLFCWTSVVLHVIDIGGVDAGGFVVSARDVFAEPAPIPPIKYVEAGRIRSEIEDVLLRSSRLPGFLALDLRAAYSANLTARRQIEGMLAAYGADVVKMAMKRMLSDAEQRLRERLLRLPDGTWSATHYLDSAGTGDRGVYAVRLEMRKAQDRLIFDFTRSDRQVGMINCTACGARGGVASGLLPIMAGDLPWALGGLMRCVDVVTKPGTLVDAVFPAAVSKGAIAGAMVASNAAVETMSKMLDSDRELRRHLLAGSGGSAAITNLVGAHADGTPFFGGLWEGATIGIGARSHADGLAAGGWLSISQGRVADVEAQELFTPMLYLWRRLEPDSGGPGLHRGGRAGSCCIVPHKIAGDMQFVISSSGKAVPQNPGLAGGYPGSSQRDVFYRGADVHSAFERGEMPTSSEALEGAPDAVAVHAVGTFGREDAFVWITQGGGGYLDPLLRPAAAVARDVIEGAVRAETAQSIYGVVLKEDGTPDVAASEACRAEARRARAKASGVWSTGKTQGAINQNEDATGGRRIDENLALVDEGAGQECVRCRHCGGRVADGLDQLLDGLLLVESGPRNAGPQISPDPAVFVDDEIVFRQYLCPSCLTAVTSEVVPRSHEDVAMRLEWAAVEPGSEPTATTSSGPIS